ncbi:hypothetical protein [Thermogutta sp.]|uniref:hypothetical protein n=1 Tax=Thermogutta sp. TaxID=1962930 RepID=UPI0032209016
MTEMKLINLTPHAICVRSGDQEVVIPPSGQIARVKVDYRPHEIIVVDGLSIPVSLELKAEVEGLPDPQPNTRYIVSRVVLDACLERTDLMVPDTSRAIRDEKGNIVAVPGFIVTA